MRLLVALFVFMASGAVQAGYSSGAGCFDQLGDAVTAMRSASGDCMAGDCRMLSYVPSSGVVQVIGANGYVASYSGFGSCSTVTATPSYPSTPWYGLDPGAITAINGGTGTGSNQMSLGGWTMTTEQGAQIGVSILQVWAVAFVFKVLARFLQESDGSEREVS